MLKKIKDNLELICIVVIVCIVFLLGKSCGNKVIKTLEPKVVTITNYRDTIFPKDTVYESKWDPSKPNYDTVWIPFDSVDVNKILVYNDTIKKPEYEAYTETTVQGILRDMKLGIKLKVPLMIKDCTVVKKDSLIYRPYKYEIHAGGIIGFKTLIPVIEMSINKATYGAGYDILNKSIIFTAKYRLHGWTSKSKKKK